MPKTMLNGGIQWRRCVVNQNCWRNAFQQLSYSKTKYIFILIKTYFDRNRKIKTLHYNRFMIGDKINNFNE